MTAKNYACIRGGVVDNVIVLDDDVPHDPEYLEHMAATWDSIVPANTLPGTVEPGATRVGARWVGRTNPLHPDYSAPAVVDRIAAVSEAMRARGVPQAQVAKALDAVREVFGG